MVASAFRCSTLVFTVVTVVFGPPLAAADLALVGGRLIDGTGGLTVEDAVVLVRDDRIVAVGPRGSVEIPGDAMVIDLEGYSVLPGFVNAHVHHALNPSNLRRWAAGGVTTVRDLGCGPTSLALFYSLVEQTPEMARLVAAGPLITVPNGYPIVPFGSSWVLPVTSVEHARAAAEDLFDTQGVDLLKLAIESGNGTIPVMSVEIAQELVAVAHERGTVASAHVTLVCDLDLALASGADDFAHMIRDRALTGTELRQVIDADVTWVPTLELWQCVGEGALPVAVYNLRRFVEAGGRVALGTDYDGYTCDWEIGMPMTEVRLMAQAEMTPMQIIESATAHGARVCNLEDEIGTVTVGKLADLIAVVGNPLADLEALDDVRLVVRSGVVIKDEVVPVVTTPPRRADGRAP
jgi:imidazolonepropionase-like amidohydrolase